MAACRCSSVFGGMHVEERGRTSSLLLTKRISCRVPVTVNFNMPFHFDNTSTINSYYHLSNIPVLMLYV
jgi:hypothetical protein